MTPTQTMWHLISQANSITLLTHFKPDADGISACAALDHILRAMGKQVDAIYPSTTDQIIKRQPATIHIATHSHIPDLLIACDTANIERLYYPDSFKGIPLINIDHHISNSINGTLNIVNAAAASTCEELYNLIAAHDENLIDIHVAQCLLYGILYDTQTFYTNNTTANTLRVAAALVDKGAKLPALNLELNAYKTLSLLTLWGKLLQTAHVDTTKNVAWITIAQADMEKHGMPRSALEGFSNYFASVSDVDITIFAYETETGSTKVSLRSKYADVNALAKNFGGGGHKCASGTSSQEFSPQAFAEKLVDLI
jgi:bifunctional oligoribonuclease and PAP phosphatase NrnA